MAPGGARALQPGENPAAVAAVLQGVFGQIPEAVALVDRPDARIQQTPGLPDQVVEALSAGGQGILTYKVGLNSADQQAVKAGLYAGTIYRVLDGERESGAVIKRYLDRAVLEAGKDGHVIVLGRSYPETVTALFSWALSAKANTVSLAPVSAVMMAR